MRGRVNGSESRGRQCASTLIYRERERQCARGRVSGSDWRESVSAREGERE